MTEMNKFFFDKGLTSNKRVFKGFVLHCGNNQDEEQGKINLRAVITRSLIETYEKCDKNSTNMPDLILETSAGEKNEILSNLKDFMRFIKETKKEIAAL